MDSGLWRVLYKKFLVTAPVLANPDISRPFIVQTYVSGFGIGVVGAEKVVGYLSRSLINQEKEYYFEGSHFKVITDYLLLSPSKL